MHGNNWKNVQCFIGTRDATQARSHAQKFFQRMRSKLTKSKSVKGDFVSRLADIIREETTLTNLAKNQLSNLINNFIFNDLSNYSVVEEKVEDEQELQLNETLTKCSSGSGKFFRKASDAEFPFKVQKIRKPSGHDNSFKNNRTCSTISDESHEDVYSAMKVYLKNKFNNSNFNIGSKTLTCTNGDFYNHKSQDQTSQLLNKSNIVDNYFNDNNNFFNDKQLEFLGSFAPSKYTNNLELNEFKEENPFKLDFDDDSLYNFQIGNHREFGNNVLNSNEDLFEFAEDSCAKYFDL
jgi:hypothetical protein